jgi:hypothetical protein
MMPDRLIRYHSRRSPASLVAIGGVVFHVL